MSIAHFSSMSVDIKNGSILCLAGPNAGDGTRQNNVVAEIVIVDSAKKSKMKKMAELLAALGNAAKLIPDKLAPLAIMGTRKLVMTVSLEDVAAYEFEFAIQTDGRIRFSVEVFVPENKHSKVIAKCVMDIEKLRDFTEMLFRLHDIVNVQTEHVVRLGDTVFLYTPGSRRGDKFIASHGLLFTGMDYEVELCRQLTDRACSVKFANIVSELSSFIGNLSIGYYVDCDNKMIIREMLELFHSVKNKLDLDESFSETSPDIQVRNTKQTTTGEEGDSLSVIRFRVQYFREDNTLDIIFRENDKMIFVVRVDGAVSPIRSSVYNIINFCDAILNNM